MRPKSEEIKDIADGSCVINVRGEFIPIIFLHSILGIRGAIHDPSKALVVLVENGSNMMGVVVDELIGQQQVVIKSLEENSDRIDGISGATILGDGKVSLILDISHLDKMKPVIIEDDTPSPAPSGGDDSGESNEADSADSAEAA